MKCKTLKLKINSSQNSMPELNPCCPAVFLSYWGVQKPAKSVYDMPLIGFCSLNNLYKDLYELSKLLAVPQIAEYSLIYS